MKFNKKVLSNGLTVLHEERDVPVTTVMLAAKYGAMYESSEEKGIAHFIEHLCFKGTEKRTVDDIAREVEGVGGELNAFTSEEMTAYHVKLPSSHLNVAMDVIFDIFFNASFPEAEVEKEGNVICEEIKMYRDNPRAHVLEMIKNNLYKEPFGSFVAGSEETVRGIKREQLFRKHRENYVPKNSVLAVVGNNSFKEVLEMAERFSVEREGNLREFPEIEKQSLEGSESRGDLQQTNLALGFHFPTGSEKERYAAELFYTILGQGMSSRLFKEVREKRGLVYGVKTDIDIGKNYSYMIIWAGTDPGKKEEVICICLEEFSKMKNLTEEELFQAKVRVVGGRKVDSENSNDVALNLIFEEISGDAKEYYSFEDRINSVTLEDIKALAEITEHASFSLGP